MRTFKAILRTESGADAGHRLIEAVDLRSAIDLASSTVKAEGKQNSLRVVWVAETDFSYAKRKAVEYAA